MEQKRFNRVRACPCGCGWVWCGPCQEFYQPGSNHASQADPTEHEPASVQPDRSPE